ncbi:DUF3885 domain-containing protein [Bacillus taeanensis]|uniref:DUF3885 domain-containing protein n=1 Tax=Bacillus taeanensis TaxID=273032 RepID=A0A366XY91_9BACI|nr:hypothetical protein [Bacillus taeanensis]RBW71380.1 hypothetical protein DS031_01125 [Bacillus taeanensis]
MNNTELLTDYLKEEFPMLQEGLLHLNYSPHLLNIQIKDDEHSNTALQRADTIFKTLHTKADDIFVVVNFHLPVQMTKQELCTKVDWADIFKNQRCLNRLELIEKPYDHSETSNLKTFQYCVTCQVSSIRYQRLIEHIVNQNPTLQKDGYMECFFIHPTKHIIMHIWNPEKLTVSANQKRSLKKLEKNYNDWIAAGTTDELKTKQKIV